MSEFRHAPVPDCHANPRDPRQMRIVSSHVITCCDFCKRAITVPRWIVENKERDGTPVRCDECRDTFHRKRAENWRMIQAARRFETERAGREAERRLPPRRQDGLSRGNDRRPNPDVRR